MSFNKAWQDRPAVTVCVTTYRQAGYIAQAIDSILMQETNFNVHLLIHDDASPDGTADIVRSYAQRHPDQIRCVCQTENQYSQNIGIQGQILSPMVETAFVALNEGDDYWLDPNKLQTQYDYMMANPDCALLCHAARQVSADGVPGERIYRMDWAAGQPDGDLSMSDLIRVGSGVPTNSYFYRRIFAADGFPAFYNDCLVGDYPMILYLGTCGRVHFMNRPMSAYRHNAAGSWTRSWVVDPTRYQRTNQSVMTMLTAFDAYTGGRWHDDVQHKLTAIQFDQMLSAHDRSVLRQPPFDALYRALPVRRRIRFQLATRLKRLHEWKRRLDVRRFSKGEPPACQD